MKNNLKERFLNAGLTDAQSDACMEVLDPLCERRNISLDHGVEMMINAIHGGMWITMEEAHERLRNFLKHFPEYEPR